MEWEENSISRASTFRCLVLAGTWLAHLVEHVILDLRFLNSRPLLGVEIT